MKKKYFTEEDRKAAKNAAANAKKAAWTPEQKAAHLTRRKVEWAARTPAQVAKTKAQLATPERRATDNAAQNAKRAARTPEQKVADRAKSKAKWDARTPTQVAKAKADSRARHAARPPERKALEKDRLFYQQVLKRYRLTKEEYIALWEHQRGRCAVCSAELVFRAQNAQMDHDHCTGKARGFLCIPCNLALGVIEKLDRKGLHLILDYLEKNGKVL